MSVSIVSGTRSYSRKRLYRAKTTTAKTATEATTSVAPLAVRMRVDIGARRAELCDLRPMSFYGGGSTSEVGFVGSFGVIVRWIVRRVRRRRRRSVLLSDVIDVRLVVVMRVVGHVEQRLPRDVRTTYGGLQTGVEQRQRGVVQALANALVRAMTETEARRRACDGCTE